MATNFPTSLDTLTNPTSSDSLSSPSHSAQHANVNDAVEALQAKVGVDGSAVTTSHDYLIDKQSVVPYADASARTTAVPSPVEGQMSYLKDTNSVEVYDGSAWAAVGGGGKILQVVSTTKSDVWSESVAAVGTSSLVTGLTATITPSSASSKVLVFVTLHMHLNQWAWPFVFLMRDTTHIGGGVASGSMPSITFGDFSGEGAGSSYGGVGNLTGHYLDSPSSTSALTYGVKFYNPYGLTATLALNECYYYTSANNGRFSSMITVMEVAA